MTPEPFDPKAVDLARRFLDICQGEGVTYDRVFEALLRAYAAVAKNYPAGPHIPAEQLLRLGTHLTLGHDEPTGPVH